MKPALLLLGAGLLGGCPALAQDFTNAGALVVVQPGASVYVGTGGLRNQVGGTFTTAGTLRVDGPLTTAGTLDLSTGALEVRGDFTNSGTLLPGTSPVTFSGLADQLLTPGSATFYQVQVSKPTAGANTLRLAGDLTISHLLQFGGGYVNTQAPGGTLYTLRLPEGASLGGEASGRYVVGALQVTRTVVSGVTVDFGHGAVLNPAANNLGPVSIIRTAGLQLADVSYGQNLGNPGLRSIDRLYTVAPAIQPSTPVQLTLSWLPDNDHGLTDFTQARVWQQPAAGLAWAAVGPATNASSRSIVSSPTVLTRFTVSNAANPLPARPAMPTAGGFVVYPTRVPSGQAATYLYAGPAEAGTLLVLDALGRAVRRLPVDGRAQGEVPLAGLAAGAYLLRYTTPTASFAGRCVVE